jgi:hypothetical protein
VPRLRFILGLGLALAAHPATAQNIVTSPGPDRVAVTIYRDPQRFPHSPPNPEWLNGYALISETRRISVPAGESTIRFAGVAGGIVPESAIVTGFPEGFIERNRDASLLSPASLLDNNLGRRVRLRRTSRATGAVRQQEAVIRSSADGAVVLQTPDGYEALRCTGQNETLVYDGVPAGLAASPTLSVRARAAQAVTATITLSYLATGFDWQANYIARLAPDGRHVDLFAWLTLLNGDETSFPDAETQAVAGHVNREQPSDYVEDEETSLNLRCWPQSSTSDPQGQQALVPQRRIRVRSDGIVYGGGGGDGEEAIMVTGTRIVYREELGDLKLYRVPEPVTVAANSQKQVALLEQPRVRVDTVYRRRISPRDDFDFEPANRVLVTRNRREEGLGLPLPAGAVVLFDGPRERPILVGEGSIRDRAVGEDVEILVGEATGVLVGVEFDDETDEEGENYVLTVSNDRAVPVRFEAEFQVDEEDVFTPRRHLRSRGGMPHWTVTVPANGTATLRYRVDNRPEQPDPPNPEDD